jgi:diguanylate cyclase (GGDEF)-like protein
LPDGGPSGGAGQADADPHGPQPVPNRSLRAATGRSAGVQRRRVAFALPNHRESATRAIAYFLLAAGLVIGVCAFALPGFAGHTALGKWATVAVAVVMVAGGAVCWRVPERVPDAFFVVVPLVAVVLTCTLDLITKDSSLGAHLYFLWPVLYASTYLRRATVYGVLGMVFAADAAVVFVLEPPAQAAADLASMVTALTVSAVVIIRLRERGDQLVTVLETQALSDPLTGVGNRRAFARDIEEAVARCHRTGTPLSLVTIDVDRFKSINDRWGHAVGDAALRAVAGALHSVIRRSDVIARLGGDEFVLLLEAGPEGAHRVAEAIRDEVAIIRDLPSGPPTLSIGLASMPMDADDIESLMAASDAALYAAKAGGRNCIAAGREGLIRIA